ncbi:MAG TPA: sodium ion-translocating decarboxylase subunit beta [Anaerolineaceae bacterium]
MVQREAFRDDFDNFILFHAMGANAAGQVGSVIAGGIVLAIMTSGLVH